MADNNNLLISAIVSPPVQPAAIPTPGRSAPISEQTRPPDGNDSFDRGQWWKNRATGRVENEKTETAEPALNPDGQSDGQAQAAKPGEPITPQGRPLKASEKFLLMELQATDIKIKAHENAHLAAAGPYATSGANYSYTRGPDGNLYAVGGEVGIDTSEERTPEMTITKMRIVQQAALAPADPSPQDRSVAAAAASKMIDAYTELQRTRSQASRADRKLAAGREAGQTEKATSKPQGAAAQEPEGAAAGQANAPQGIQPVTNGRESAVGLIPTTSGPQASGPGPSPVGRISLWI